MVAKAKGGCGRRREDEPTSTHDGVDVGFKLRCPSKIMFDRDAEWHDKKIKKVINLKVF